MDWHKAVKIANIVVNNRWMSNSGLSMATLKNALQPGEDQIKK